MDWLALAVGLVKLLASFTNWLQTRGLIAGAVAEAVNRGLIAALEEIDRARKVEAAAAVIHAADPTDDAFDRDFERLDE